MKMYKIKANAEEAKSEVIPNLEKLGYYFHGVILPNCDSVQAWFDGSISTHNNHSEVEDNFQELSKEVLAKMCKPSFNDQLVEVEKARQECLKMENLKIRVNSEAESKEVVKIFTEYGGKKLAPEFMYAKDGIKAVCLIDKYIYINTISFESCDDRLKEITLPQLRDLVVLKRNDKNDRNVIDPIVDANLYLTSDRRLYVFHAAKKEWMLSIFSNDEEKISKLKPIEKQMKEYLEPQQPESLPFVDDEKTGIEATLSERESQYGSFEDVARITQHLLKTLSCGTSFGDLTATQVEALHMICSKMARIVNGNPDHKDSWHDIAGYAKLIEDSI